jgi:RND family efflux transporter MFP subunit
VTRRGRWLGAAGAALVLVVVAGGAHVLWRRAGAPTPAPAAAEAPPAGTEGLVTFLMEQQWAIRMKLARARPAVVARQLTVTARVAPAAGHHAVVAPPVGGLIAGGPVPRVGQAVRRGETLAILRQTPTAAETAQIVAGQLQLEIERTRLEAERRRLAEAVTETALRVEHARVELERARRLYDRKAYALRQLQAAETEFRAAQSAHAAAVGQREALAERSEATPGPPPATYTVLAPIGGTVVRVAKAAGEQVAPGEAIAEIVDLDAVWIEVPVFERDLARLGARPRGAFTTPAAPGQEFAGTLVDLGAVVHRESRTATLIFQVPNRERQLRIGQQVEARLQTGERVEALLVPREAVLEAEGKRFVYVLRSGETFERREVTAGDEQGAEIAVLGGLQAGERVVTQGAYQLRQHELRPAAPGAHTHET